MTVVSLDDICAHLNIEGSEHDQELQTFIDAAEAMIAGRVGPLEPTTITSVVSTGGGELTLPTKPVISIISAAATGVAWPGVSYGSSELLLDRETGRVTSSSDFGLSAGRYTVVYEAGREECPADLVLAVKELVRHFWERSQRGRGSRRGSDDQAATTTYLIPNFVQGLLEPHQKYRLGFI
jgi:hypothetical protein